MLSKGNGGILARPDANHTHRECRALEWPHNSLAQHIPAPRGRG